MEVKSKESPKKRIKPTPIEITETLNEKSGLSLINADSTVLNDENNIAEQSNPPKLNEETNQSSELRHNESDSGKNEVNEDISNENDRDSDASVSSTELSKLEAETEKENIQNQQNSDKNLSEASSSVLEVNYNKPPEILELETKLNKFLDLVKHAVKKSQFEDVITKKCSSVLNYFEKCNTNVNEKSFIKLLRDCTLMTDNATAAGATIAFHKIYEHIKLLSQKSQAEVMPEDVHRVQKLEKVLTLLMRKIHKLEHSEINFDDEEDSTYMQVDKYKTRVKKVYEKYCQLIDKNPNSGRLTYEKINFEKSSYKEINEAINKKYKNSLNFPSYYEMEKFIRAIVKERRLDISESKVKSESKKCFKAFGKMLQRRRRAELYDCHLSFIEGTNDPATQDPVLEETLKKNLIEGEEKLNQLLHGYVVQAERAKEDDMEQECSENSSEEHE